MLRKFPVLANALNAKCMRGIMLYYQRIAKSTTIRNIFKALFKMQRFAKVFNGFQPFTIFEKGSMLNVWQDSEFFSALHDFTICL